MAGPETQKSPQEQPENRLKGDIVSEAVRSGRKTIGEYDKDVHDEGEWDEQKIQVRMNEKLSKHEHLSLLETYDFNADTDRMQALRLITNAQKENRELTGAEESEVIAAQIRVTVLENLSRAADAYVDMMDLYRRYKAQGLRPELKEEEVALQHSALVNSVAENRVAITEKMLLGQLNSQEKAVLQQEALQTDRELLRLLAAEDTDVPGGNKEGILPVHRLILSVLNNEYRDIMDDYQDAASKDFSKRKERADKANVRLHQAFPGKDDSQILEEDQDRVLSEIEPGYTMHEYHNDLLVLRRDAATFNTLKERGKKNIERLAELNTIMGRYQIHRAELSSIRHHFDQGYVANQKQSPLPGTTNPEAIKASREFLDSQQTGAVVSLEKHLERVDTGVLKVGIAEKTEALWNERGRPFVSKLADRIATLETAWMPNVPWLPDDYLQNGTREHLLGGLYDALGWPRDENGMPKKQEDLTPSEFRALQEKQKSIEKVIDQFREKGSFEKVRQSVTVAKILVNRKDLQSQNFLETAGEIDTETLPQEALTPENMDELIRKYGAPTVYKMCYVQLRDNWETYSTDYTQLLTDFHETIGIHYDFQRHFTDFAESQMDIAKLLALVALGGIVVGAVGTMAIWKLTKGSVKLAGKTVRGGVRLGGKALETGVEGTRKTVEIVRSMKTVEKGAETFKTWEELKEAIDLARAQKDNKKLLELLKNPLLKTAAETSPEAKVLLRVTRMATVGKWAGRTLGFLCVLVDAALLGVNEMQIADARKNGNEGLAQTLEAKRITLGVGATAGAGLLFASGSVLAIGLPVVIGGQLYADAIYDAVVDWEKSSKEWMQEKPEDLLKRLKDLPVNTVNIGHRTGLGDSPIYRLWKKATWSRKEIDTEDAKKWEAVEGINRSVRQEILTAYFLQTMTVDRLPNETDQEFQNKVTASVLDRLTYISTISSHTYDTSIFGKRMLDLAEPYAELMEIRRSLQAQKKPLTLTYDWEGETKTLDLSLLDYALSGAKSGKNEDKASMDFFGIIHQYQEEVSVQKQAVRDLRKELQQKE